MANSRGYVIVDSHLHVFDLKLRDSFPNQNVSHSFPSEKDHAAICKTTTLDEAGKVTGDSGVENVVFVMCYDDCPEEARWVYKTAQKHAFLKAIVAGLDLTKHEKLEVCVQEFKAEFKRPKFVGVRHLIGLYEPDFLLRDDVHKGLSILERHGLTIDLHSYPNTIAHIAVIAAKFPRLKMVIDHLAKPNIQAGEIDQWKKDMSCAANCPNVYVKLSGLIIEANPWSVEVFQPYVDFCLQTFGVSRCIYGSDWPVCRLAKGVDYKETLKLMEDLLSRLAFSDKKAIFQDNAIAFYGLHQVIQ